MDKLLVCVFSLFLLKMIEKYDHQSTLLKVLNDKHLSGQSSEQSSCSAVLFTYLTDRSRAFPPDPMLK